MKLPVMNKPAMVVENEFQAPPEYVAKWLQDMQEDDARFFGDARKIKVLERSDKHVKLMAEVPEMGAINTYLRVETPTKWVADVDFVNQGQLMGKARVVETVQPKAIGTLHRAEIYMQPMNEQFAAMLTQMGPEWEKGLKAAFDKMKQELNAEYKAGKPPAKK